MLEIKIYIPHCLIYDAHVHSFRLYFYSTSSSPLLLRGTPDTARILCRSFTLKHHRQLQVKDLPKVPTWWLERDSNPQPFGQNGTNLPMNHHIPHVVTHMWPICLKPVASRKIRFQDFEQKPYERHFSNRYITTNFNFNVFILYENKNLNQRNLEGYF